MSDTYTAAPLDPESSAREACLSLLHQQLPLALTASLVAAVMVLVALNNDPNLRAPLTLWLVTLVVCHGLSLILLPWIGRISRPDWRQRSYFLIYFCSGLIWGALSLSLLSFGLDIAQQLLIVLALLTSAGAVLVSGVGVFPTYPLFLLPAILPLAGIAVALGGRFNLLLTGLLAVFIVSTLLATLGLHRTLMQLLRERAESAQRLAEFSVNTRRLQREVNDYRKLRGQLDKQETLHKDLLEAMDCGVYLLEAQRFIYANPAWEDFCGYTLEELQNLSLEQLLHPDDQQQLELIQRQTPTGSYLHCRILRRNGPPCRVHLSIRTFSLGQRMVTLGTALALHQPASEKTRTSPPIPVYSASPPDS